MTQIRGLASVRFRIWVSSLVVGAGLYLAGDARAQTILLDNFDSVTIRVVQPNESNPQLRYLWYQYSGDFTEGPDFGITTISPLGYSHDEYTSLKTAITSGNFYLQFYPNDGTVWRNMRDYTQPSSAWQFNTFNRMRLWIKVPPQAVAFSGGRANLQLGTYVRSSTGSPYSAEDGGGHYYHFFNIPYTGEWHQIILDTHPNYRRGSDPGGLEIGDQLHPSGESNFNYFDLLTRFYLDFQGSMTSAPAEFYVDGFELYNETRPENTQQIYSLNGVYVGSTNTILAKWMRDKDENTVNHEVRYAFEDIFSVGWASATPAPDGIVVPPGWQGYNGMEWSTQSIDVTGRSVIYLAIKPQNSTQFRQIGIPIPPKAPTGLTVVK